MVWIHSITEGPDTTLMNPVSTKKLRRLAQHIGLAPEQHVLDIGAGRCGPALLFAREFGCRVTAVEPYAPFLADAHRLVDQAGLGDSFELMRAAGADFRIEPERYDVAMCLGATWAWGGLDGTLEALAPGVGSGGHVVAGEPYRLSPDEPVADHAHNLTLPEIVERFERRALAVISLIRSSVDDWDAYQSERVRNLLDWVRDNPSHPEVEQVKAWRREHTAELTGRKIGWAIVSGRKTVDA